MPKIHEAAGMYAHTQSDPSRALPLVSAQPTQEIEWPYRVGSSIVFRVFGKAIVLGVWTGRKDEESALMEAIGGRRVEDAG